MSERIELTGDNFTLNNTPPVISTSITISHGDSKQNAESLKQQILDDQEKAKKWDKHLEFLISQGLNEKEAEQFALGVDRAFIEEATRLSQENKQLDEMVKILVNKIKVLEKQS